MPSNRPDFDDLTSAQQDDYLYAQHEAQHHDEDVYKLLPASHPWSTRDEGDDDAATDERHSRTERGLLKLLAERGMPAPSEIHHKEGSVEFLWHDRKVAVVIDLDDLDEVSEGAE